VDLVASYAGAFNAREFSGLKGIRPVMDLVARDLASRVRSANESAPARTR